MRRIVVLSLLLAALSCKHQPKASPAPAPVSSATARPATPSSAAVAGLAPGNSAGDAGSAAGAGGASAASLQPEHYRWLSATNLKFPPAVDTLEARFPPPPGYQRVALAPGSFGQWLRRLPLAAPGTPVLNNSGGAAYSGEDEYVAGVVAIDVGAGDLQQSADAIVRLHAEWLWASDQADALNYRSASNQAVH